MLAFQHRFYPRIQNVIKRVKNLACRAPKKSVRMSGHCTRMSNQSHQYRTHAHLIKTKMHAEFQIKRCIFRTLSLRVAIREVQRRAEHWHSQLYAFTSTLSTGCSSQKRPQPRLTAPMSWESSCFCSSALAFALASFSLFHSLISGTSWFLIWDFSAFSLGVSHSYLSYSGASLCMSDTG